MRKTMDNSMLEQWYEQVILPNYREIDVAEIRWKDHGQIGSDAWAHYFEDANGREYVLVFEDFPGDTFLDDGLTHDVVPITGHFTLYRER